MNILYNKNFFRATCFIAAFAAAGAGFLFRENIFRTDAERKQQAYILLNTSDFVENFENNAKAFAAIESLSSEKMIPIFSDIRLYSNLSMTALGNLQMKSEASEDLFSFLTACSEVSEHVIRNGITSNYEQLFSVLNSYSDRITKQAIPKIYNEKGSFEEILTDIFSDTSLESVLFENGFGDYAPKNGFLTLGGGKISSSEAIDIARKHLGKRAYLSAEYSEGEIPVYNVGGKNISAIVSSQSGILMQFLFDLPEGEEKTDKSKAKSYAVSFLTEMGFTDSEPLFFEHTGGLYIFKYIPTQSKIICLDEEITVGVSDISGRICLFDAINYYRYHTKKLTIPKDIISSESVIERYQLTNSPTLCKIERKPGIESLCYKVSSENNDIYISAYSGDIISTTH